MRTEKHGGLRHNSGSKPQCEVVSKSRRVFSVESNDFDATFRCDFSRRPALLSRSTMKLSLPKPQSPLTNFGRHWTTLPESLIDRPAVKIVCRALRSHPRPSGQASV